MADAPLRIRLSRAKGWRLPDNTVKVDRSTLWGNPFVVGIDGTAVYCVQLYRMMLAAMHCLTSEATLAAQERAHRHVSRHIANLRGKNLACWCALDKPCHADVLLELANAEERAA